MTETMSQTSSYPFEQQSSMYMTSPFSPLPAHFSFQPSMQQFNPMYPMGYGEFNDVPPFVPYDLPPPNAFSGYPIESMGTSMPINYEQQQQQQQYPTQMQNVPKGPDQLISNSSLSHLAAPFEPQQTNSTRSTNIQTLQFIPSQVLRNIPKNHK